MRRKKNTIVLLVLSRLNMNNYNKGSRREHELMEICEENGYVVVRSAGSGTGGKKANGEEREQPDIIAGDGENVFAFESKAEGSDTLYIPKVEVEDLEYFAECFGAEPRIAVRFDREDFYVFEKDEMHETNKNYRVKKENINNGTHVNDLL